MVNFMIYKDFYSFISAIMRHNRISLSIFYNKPVVVLFIIFFWNFSLLWGQIDGDYQTRATGDWNDNNTWQVYSSGSWSDCGVGDYPGTAGGAGTVYITGGSTVSVTADVTNNIGALNFAGNNATNNVQFSGSYNLNITGAITINPPTSNFNDNGLYVNSGFVTCTSLTSTDGGNPNRDCQVGISDGSLTVNGDIAMNRNKNRNDITFTGAGILNVTGKLATGQLTCVANSTINIGGLFKPKGIYGEHINSQF